MPLSNFQDVVVLSSDTLNAGIERFAIGSSAGSKSIVFAQDVALASAMHLAASNPTAARTAILPDANGTIGYLTNISAGTTAVTNGQIVFSNSNEFVFGINASTFTAGLTTISAQPVGNDIHSATVSFSQSSSFNGNAATVTQDLVSAVRVTVPYPIAVTLIDPRASDCTYSFRGGSGGVQSLSGTGTVSWWCGIYTINGSTAGVVSSVSKSTSSSSTAQSPTVALNVTVTFDPTLLPSFTWSVTPGDYMFMTGVRMSAVFVFAGATTTVSGAHSVTLNMAGVSNLPEVSYSVPYWKDGTISTSATSYALSQVNNSGGVFSFSMRPYAAMVGS